MDNRYDNQQEKELLKKILGELHFSIFPCELNQKIPATGGWQGRASSDPLQVEKWFDLKKFNYGVLCGTEHRGKYLTVVDVDNKNGKHGTESWATLTRDIESDRLKTFSVKTPSGGYHYFFYAREQFGNRTNILEGIDTRSRGGYVVGAGSSIDGNSYVILNDSPITDMPEKLELILTRKWNTHEENDVARNDEELNRLALDESGRVRLLELLSIHANQGGFSSYEDWLRLGGALKHEGFTVEDWQSLSWENAREECLRKWNTLPTSELTMGSLVYFARKADPEFLVLQSAVVSEIDIHKMLNDADFVERFIRRNGEKIRYVRNIGWAKYNGKCWDTGVFKSEMYELVIDVAKSAYEEEIEYLLSRLEHETDADEQKALKDCLKKFMAAKNRYQNSAGIQSALEVLSGMSSILVDPEVFDAGNYLTLENGVYDFDEDRLIPHSPSIMTATMAHYSYDQEAKAPIWEKCIREYFLENEEIGRFVQKCVGYTLTTSVKEQKVFFCHGAHGANGKSTFFNTLYALMGSASATISSNVLMDSNGREAQEQLAHLVSARFVRSTELKKNDRFDESLIKAVSGKDPLRCRALYQKSFDYFPIFKLWIFGNNKPGVNDLGNGFWRRLVLIPFNRVFKEEEQDKDVESKLEKELPGIFNWALEGLRRYRTEGLQMPECMSEEVQKYKVEENKVMSFMLECTEEGFYGTEVTPYGELFQAFRTYCDDNGLQPTSAKSFTRQLEVLEQEVGFKLDYGSGNRRIIRGRTLASNHS
jgi:P4 family phage/plasmid primase-like protien